MKKKLGANVSKFLMCVSFLIIAVPSYAAETVNAASSEKGFITKKREFKGYQKRARLLGRNFSNFYSPAQIHEVYGFKAEAAASITNIEIRDPDGVDENYVAPGTSVKALWGGDILVLGLGGDFTNFSSNPEGNEVEERFYNIYQIEPIAGMTFGDHVTVGVSSKHTRSELSTNRPRTETYGEEEFKVTNRYNVETYGVAVHTSKWETGLAYATSAKDSEVFAENGEINRIYIPANTTLYGRGNLSDPIEVLAAVSYVEYERTSVGANPAFSKFRIDDRLAGRLQLAYWTVARSRVALTLKHTPATYYGSFISGIDSANMQREANLYGANIDLVKALENKRSSFGLMAGFERGERDLRVDGVRYAKREEHFTLAGSLNLSF